MPTYEYVCTSCGQHVEVFQRITEDPLTTCGACGGTLRKVFYPAGIVFKGSGFYATDNRSKPKTSTSSSSTSSPSSSSSSSSSEGSGSSSSEGSGGGSSTDSSKPPKEKSA
ncbi:MAG: FmdB family zinc ribbon protein [Solirubrobacterales bacterium]